jgi:hypothetical protein
LQKLLENRDKYRAGLETVRKPVREELQQRKEEAQKSGVLRKLEEATQDIAAFEKSDKLPGTLLATKPELAKQFRTGKEQLHQQMIRGLEAAIQDYTRLDKLADAAVIREKLGEYKATLRAPPPTQKKKVRRRRR